MIVGLAAVFGCQSPLPVPTGYMANTEVRDWAAEVLAEGPVPEKSVTVYLEDATQLGVVGSVVLRGGRAASLASYLATSCRKSAKQSPVLDSRNETISLQLFTRRGLFMCSVRLDEIAQQHGPEVAKHKEEIRRLLLDAYREQEAAKAAERKRYPWKKG